MSFTFLKLLKIIWDVFTVILIAVGIFALINIYSGEKMQNFLLDRNHGAIQQTLAVSLENQRQVLEHQETIMKALKQVERNIKLDLEQVKEIAELNRKLAIILKLLGDKQ